MTRDRFTAVTPTPAEYQQTVAMRTLYRELAAMIEQLPDTRQRVAALDHLESSCMWAAKAVSL